MKYTNRNMLYVLCLLSVSNVIFAARVIYNETTDSLYTAGYHAGKDAVRVVGPLLIPAGGKSTIDVVRTGFFSTKKRYLVVARSMGDLQQTLSLQALKVLPHKDMTNPSPSFYLSDKEGGRLKMYNVLEHTTLVQTLQKAGTAIKETVVEVVIGKDNLPAVKNNSYRKKVARVRTGNALPSEEKAYLQKRMPKVKSALERFLGRSLAGKKIPKVAFVLSGGGNRAMFASCGYMVGAQEIGLLDAVTYMVALSGSTWFLGSWFASGVSIDDFRRTFVQTMEKGIASLTAREFGLIADAFKVKIAYDEPLTTMDLFGALLGNALLKRFGDKRQMTYLSDQKKRIQNGDWAFPIYTAVDGSRQTHMLHKWYEFTPYEVGGAWLNHYIPTWGFGRRFEKGSSVTDDPEISLSFLFGLWGSAFAVDVERMWQEVLKANAKAATAEKVVRKLILNQIGDRRITQSEEFNFTAGMTSSFLRDSKKMYMIDAGFASGLPYPAVSGKRPERAPEVLIFIENSENVAQIKEDVEKASTELRKAEKYARDNGLKFPKIDRVTPNAITVYRDEKDPLCPIVIWMPLVRDAKKWSVFGGDRRFTNISTFELSKCVKDAFCPSVNFTYKAIQANQLVSLGHFNMIACKQEIKNAINWKIDHM